MLSIRECASSPSMEQFETVSNVSEGISSNLSSLSGLTGYEEELYDLKHFINLPASSPRLIKSSDHGQQYEVFEERIKTLNIELQNSLRLNEKYKNDLGNMERKTELVFHEKFEKLLRRNAQLEAQLSVANEHINLLSGNETKRQDFELQNKLGLLEDDVKHWKKESERFEIINNRFRLEMEEMKLEVSTKINSIGALKGKIVELHLEMQNLNQDNVTVHNLLAITSNELDSFKKSEKWYKEQLHQCRGSKSEALEEISQLQLNLLGKEREFVRLKNNYEVLNLNNVHEKDAKQKLLKDIKELKEKNDVKAVIIEENPSDDYEAIIETLTRELNSIKDAINQQQGLFERINKDNSDLIAQNTTLKKNLNAKEIQISNLESETMDLNIKLEILASRLRENENLLLQTVGEKTELQVSLTGANREKRDIEEAVKTIRENFSKFASNYNKIKEELNSKNKQLCELEYAKETKIVESNETNRLAADLIQAKKQLKDLEVLNQNQQAELMLKTQVIFDLKQAANNSQENLQTVQELNKKFTEKVKSLESENCELNCKLTNNLNGFKTEALSLNWIFSALHEIQANHRTKIIFKPPPQCPKNLEEMFVKICKLLHSIWESRIIKEKIQRVEERCRNLQKRQEEDLEVLEQIRMGPKGSNGDGDREKLYEELKHMKILYKAKEEENNEKRKRYEVNNRTLLKKVKEHMRGRNSAEKRCTYLQELYNQVFDELNSCKLQENSKEGEIQNLQSICENYKNINAKMKQELIRLEKDLSLAQAAKDCDDGLQNNLAKLESQLKIYQEQLKEKELLITTLQIQIQQTVRNIAMLQKENKSILENLEKSNEELKGEKGDLVKLTGTLEKERKSMELVQAKLLEEQKKHSDCVMQLENVQQVSQHVQEKNKLLSEEIEMLTSKLNNSKNEFNRLEAKNNSLTNAWSRKESLMEMFTTNLQSEIQVLQTELTSLRSDKNFLQRLCSDLKLALETSSNQNKVLKKHIETLSSESKESNSLPNLPSPSKYDDAYINQLLQQSSSPKIDKPLGDLQNCLNSLKKEMVCLRKQVTDRTASRI